MGKLFVFGCSFSTGFNLDFVENVDNLIWPKLLADKLNLELFNLAHAGQCNWVNILHFIDVRDQINKDDIIIFELTFFERLNLYPTRAQLEDLREFWIRSQSDMTSVINRYKGINLRWFKKQVIDFCKQNELKIYMWSAEGKTNKEFEKYHKEIAFMPAPNDSVENKTFSIYSKWQDLIDEQHIIKPDGTVDKHFNKIGHQRLADHFENCIKNNIVYNYQ